MKLIGNSTLYLLRYSTIERSYLRGNGYGLRSCNSKIRLCKIVVTGVLLYLFAVPLILLYLHSVGSAYVLNAGY